MSKKYIATKPAPKRIERAKQAYEIHNTLRPAEVVLYLGFSFSGVPENKVLDQIVS